MLLKIYVIKQYMLLKIYVIKQYMLLKIYVIKQYMLLKINVYKITYTVNIKKPVKNNKNISSILCLFNCSLFKLLSYTNLKDEDIKFSQLKIINAANTPTDINIITFIFPSFLSKLLSLSNSSVSTLSTTSISETAAPIGEDIIEPAIIPSILYKKIIYNKEYFYGTSKIKSK